MNYGVVVNPDDFSVDEHATNDLRETMKQERSKTDWTADASYSRGGTLRELLAKCEEETGLKAPTPQWEKNPYGPHAGMPYVKEWYKKMREEGMDVWDKA